MAADPRLARGSAVVLEGDRRIAIRPIDPADADGLRVFYRSLSPRSRYARFLGAAAGISDATARRFAEVDHSASDGLVAVLQEKGPRDGTIIGHLCLEPDGVGSNELAMAIADGFRGHGIGTAMMRGAIESARDRGIRRLTATMFATNLPMRRLMLGTGLSASVDDLDGGIESIELQLAAVAPHQPNDRDAADAPRAPVRRGTVGARSLSGRRPARQGIGRIVPQRPIP
jgi:RimJ/RimL family protein N-acetyltransferase